MATKKSESSETVADESAAARIEERRARRENATTVDGSESFPPDEAS